MQTATKKGGYSFAWGEKHFPTNKNKLNDRKGMWEVYFPNLIGQNGENMELGTLNAFRMRSFAPSDPKHFQCGFSTFIVKRGAKL